MLYEQDVLAYGRFSMEEQIAVVINSRGEETEVEVPVWDWVWTISAIKS